MQKSQPSQTSPGSVGSTRPLSAPGSPGSTICRSQSPRPMSPLTYPEYMVHKESREWADGKSPGSTMGSSCNRRSYPSTGSLPHHFHRPDIGTNMYRKRPIYKQNEPSTVLPQSKYIEDLIIESSKFPAAQPPDPNLPAKIETEYWPCPPSLAVVEKEWRRRFPSKEDEEDDDEEDDEMKQLREIQRKELNKIQSGLGKLILKEELEKSKPRGRKSRSLPDRTTRSFSPQQSTCKSPSLPIHGRNSLYRLQSADFVTPQRPERKSDAAGELMCRDWNLNGTLSIRVTTELIQQSSAKESENGLQRRSSFPDTLIKANVSIAQFANTDQSSDRPSQS
ncbi:dematin isoform X2 [Stegostoma tigrinum]|uniref:dematin isoform X2 n=1 Tax=Stegostoma tigrinum TaxID=3053191 RepID=UPI00202AC7A1|nr:dematin isoform X2 [Stegostoma tigrinum]